MNELEQLLTNLTAELEQPLPAVEVPVVSAEGTSEDKLVRVIRGEVYDVAVDLREGSRTFGQWYGVLLSEENKKQFFIPKNFAHGFLVLSDYAEFCYKCTDFYHPDDEGGIAYNTPDIGVKWPIPEGMELTLSEKDTKWGTLEQYMKEKEHEKECENK